MEGLKRLRPVLIYFVFYMTVFFWLEHRTVRWHMIYSPLDSKIPFCEYFIVPYVLWYFFVIGTIIYFAFFNKSQQEYYSLILNLGMGMTLFLIISIVFPNGHQLRQPVTGENVFEKAIMILHQVDTSTNVFPSIHVFNSLACCIALLKNRRWKQSSMLVVGTVLLTISIILSTIYLKQHSIVDVLGAFVMAAILYPIAYKVNFRIHLILHRV